ncbi:MAG: SEC-C domain-containing protein [Bradymonadales bacterium]|nr:SEC-C domain-containing protein [Bradymonadales bacterium]
MGVGRNDPCPCGSGLKYKKCCARKDEIEHRVAEHIRQVDEVLDEQATVYRVWCEWRKAKEMADFNFLYDLIAKDCPLNGQFADRTAFLTACDDGTDQIPSGEPARFKTLRIIDGQEAFLLQTLGESEPGQLNVRCERIHFHRTDRGWRLWELTVREVPKSEEIPLSLALFEQGSEATAELHHPAGGQSS